MNDTELDELLNIWKAPPPNGSLRDGVRVAIEMKHRRPRKLFPGWRWLGAVAAVMVAAFLLTDTDAFPQKASPPPYTVNSEIIRYQGWNTDWGEPRSLMMTSYNQEGSEIVLSWSSPDYPMEAVFWAAKLAVSGAFERFKRQFLLMPDTEAGAFAVVYPSMAGESLVVGRGSMLVDSGCQTSHGGSKVVGQAVILDYPTTAVQQVWGGGRLRMTLWMAPELSCFALRATVEQQGPLPLMNFGERGDGTWTLVSEKKALKVTVNR